MTMLTREVHINTPKQNVWDVLADFGNIYKFNPGVRNVSLLLTHSEMPRHS